MRWDEWIPFSSPRIAPFRTRTLHVPQHFHTLPAPNAQTVSTVRTILPDMLSYSNGNNRLIDRTVTRRGNADGDGDGDGDGIEKGKSTETIAERHLNESLKNRENEGETEQDRKIEEHNSEIIEDSTVQQDSIISLLPTVSRMMQTLQPQLEAAARIASEVSTHLSQDDASALYFLNIKSPISLSR